MTAPTTAPRTLTVEQARGESVRAYLAYRNHVESCPRAYFGSACLNCRVLDQQASAADWRLAQTRGDGS